MQRQTRSTDVTAGVLDLHISSIYRHTAIMAMYLALLSSGHHCCCAWIVVRVVQERLDVRFKQWIENINDSVLLSQLFSTIECNPYALKMHSTHLDDNALFLIFQDTVTLAT